jgi:hypothetical protein
VGRGGESHPEFTRGQEMARDDQSLANFRGHESVRGTRAYAPILQTRPINGHAVDWAESPSHRLGSLQPQK